MNEMRNHEKEEAARQVDDDNGFADECSSGECHSGNRDSTHKRDASPSAPTVETNAATTPLHAAPSVERRRRRRLEQTGATSPASRRGRQANIDYFNDYYMGNADRIGRMNNSTTMALLSLLFLVVVVQKGGFYPACILKPYTINSVHAFSTHFPLLHLTSFGEKTR
ncbi:hypothetical protein HJC23_011450 [Cyclotella cryptica]|uniref:Uncharacterized protein n=1 Tax=Cyclotella cryptica TaxID=29204 RepID=A0ABD3NJR6_9STRA